MYHYVREHSSDYPNFRHLDIQDFRQQLDFFSDEYGFVEKQDFISAVQTGEPKPGVILTFDDGLQDHYQFVLPELVKRGLWGIFYIPALPYLEGKILDVHKIHLLLGRYESSEVASELRGMVSPEMVDTDCAEEFETLTYARQDNSNATLYVKRTLNYLVKVEYRAILTEQLMDRFFGGSDAFLDTVYMSESQLRELNKAEMMLGSHSINHRVMSTLTDSSQESEICDSFAALENMVGGLSPKTFCYPYGGFHSFSDVTESLLKRENTLFSFNVEQRDIAASDLVGRPQALPRFDCNQFPHGQCRTY